MRDLRLLVWLTQLGLSTALPLAGFALVGIWLHKSIGWGQWTIWVGLVLGIISAVNGFRDSLKAMSRMSKDKKADTSPPIAFNSHD